MGQKVNPVVFRIGHSEDWKSRWFSKKSYTLFLAQDVKLREFLTKKLIKAGVERIEIERSANSLIIIIKTARPGIIIGRGGGGIEQLKDDVKRFILKDTPNIGKTELRLEVEEVKMSESHASIAAQNIVEQIEKRIPYRRTLKQAIDKIIQIKGVEGVKIMLKGRLDGAEIARTEWLLRGKIPLQTLRAKIDYAQVTAFTTYGTVGVKVWIYKGEVF
ncbi:MAG: 30S ribosomal protein S3 [Candidatus Portnoybacteria bacterium RBG_19FT_COMBO_36_7]|uniref:Small ribosomal subunit protein uS3 n=1 Tax=Candidatus Portnoybacteria bacterium RBG_19FT_COMBO_36_7 TaxID=1801992 RepID=A0A1G2F7Z5_9BACT|nr:MAG: 30S ribosomal protein S3 [Candidatus Portnoybacteria bacterium RBG_19FT_COMBO_36_7]